MVLISAATKNYCQYNNRIFQIKTFEMLQAIDFTTRFVLKIDLLYLVQFFSSSKPDVLENVSFKQINEITTVEHLDFNQNQDNLVC